MKTKRIIQLFLLVIACCSFYFCLNLGEKYYTDEGKSVIKNLDFDNPEYVSGTGVTSQSGFDGGALGMGIICASSLLGIVWLETKKFE